MHRGGGAATDKGRLKQCSCCCCWVIGFVCVFLLFLSLSLMCLLVVYVCLGLIDIFRRIIVTSSCSAYPISTSAFKKRNQSARPSQIRWQNQVLLLTTTTTTTISLLPAIPVRSVPEPRFLCARRTAIVLPPPYHKNDHYREGTHSRTSPTRFGFAI